MVGKGRTVTNAYGIDASAAINWGDYPGDLHFAMVKATEGETYLSPAFRESWARLLPLTPHRLAYHYAHPDLDPAKQAALLTRTVRDAGLRPTDHYVLDLEQDGGLDPVEVS